MRKLALLVALCAARAALGHALDVAYLEVQAGGARVRASLDLSVEIAEQLVRTGPLRAPAAVESSAGAIFRATLGSGTLEAAGAACQPGTARAQLEPASLRIRLVVEAICPRPVEDLRWTFPFVDATSLDFRVLVKAVLLDEERNFLLEPGVSTLRVRAESACMFRAFVLMYIKHTGATPS